MDRRVDLEVQGALVAQDLGGMRMETIVVVCAKETPHFHRMPILLVNMPFILEIPTQPSK